MMYDLDLTAALVMVTVTVLSAVYVWSKDSGRQARAWRLLRLILRR
jgi:hypothetical protein